MKHCGPLREIDATHGDGEANRVAVIASHSKDDPDKMFLLVTVPSPAIVTLPVPIMEEEATERGEGSKVNHSLSSGSLLARPRGRGPKTSDVRASAGANGEPGRESTVGKIMSPTTLP